MRCTLSVGTLFLLATATQGQYLRSTRKLATCYSTSPSVPDDWCPVNGCPADSCAPGTAPTTAPACTSTGTWTNDWCRSHGCPPQYCALPPAGTSPTMGTTLSPTRNPSAAPTRRPTSAPTRKPTSVAAPTTTTKKPSSAPTKKPTSAPTKVPATGTAAPTITSAPTTTSGGGGISFAPYDDVTLNTQWSQAVNDLVPQDLNAIADKAGLKRVTLAFITAIDNTCKAGWAGTASYPVQGTKPWGKSVFDAVRASGKALVVSFGGASGTDLSVPCDVAGLVAIYQEVIKNYQPERLDFDIEGGFLGNTAALGRLVTALKTVQANNPTVALSFTLPVMPYGFDASQKAMVKQAVDGGLTFQVNIMAMDYGSTYDGNQGDNAIKAGDAVVHYLQTLYPAKPLAALYGLLIITPMIGVNDVTSNVFTLANAQALNSYATSKGLAGLSMWSLNRDHPCAGGVSITCSGGNVQTADYDFSKTLGK